MKIFSFSLPALLLAIWPTYSDGSETLVDGAKRVVSPYTAVFKGLPRGTPSKTVADGPLLGNGDMGVSIAGIDNGQRFWLCKNDFWKLAHDYKTGPSGPRVFGGLDVTFPGLGGGAVTEQKFYDAVTVSTWDGSKGEASVQVRSWVAATENMLVVELTASGKDSDAEVNLWAKEGNGSEVQCATHNGIQWMTRKFATNVVIETEAACAMKILGAGTSSFKIKVGQPVTILLAMQSKFKSPTPLDDACKRIEGMDQASLADLQKKHTAWWQAFWAKSTVEIGDPVLEQRYYLSNYVMASASRDPEFPPPIFGTWTTTDIPGWEGDYHLNYNHQAPFYALYAGNHIEQADPYHAPILDFRSRAQWYATNALGIRGAYYPVGIGPKGIETTRNYPDDGYARPPHIEKEGLFYFQRSNGAYCLVNIAMRWYYTYDKDYAKLLYPLVRDIADFWEDYLKFEDNRYVIYKDSIHERSHNGNDFNSMVSLGLVRNAFELALDMSRELGIESDRHAKWQHILDHLSGWSYQEMALPRGRDEDRNVEKPKVKVFRYTETGTPWWRNNTLAIQHIYPAGAIGLDSDPELLQVARNTIDVRNGWFDGNGMNSFYPAAVRVGYEPNIILAKLHEMIERISAPNGFIKGNPHGVEHCSIVPNTINEMLCMSHKGVLRLFPSWPKEKDARFANLRAWGAFLVSAELKNEKIRYVEITSEQGRKCTVQNPWPDCAVTVTRVDGKSETVTGTRFTLATKAGEKLRLVPLERKAEDTLYEAFRDPPAEARPFVRWWWNGDCVTEKEILRELDLMKAAGLGGVEINPVAMPGGATPSATEPLVWLSPEWNKMAAVATRGAKERGMIADMIVGSGWPFGGRFLKSGETIQAIGVNRKPLKGPDLFTSTMKELMKAPRVRYIVEDAAAPRLAYLRLVPANATHIEACIDLADKVKADGTIEFAIPEGEHTLHIGTWQEAFTAVVHGAPGSDGQVLNHLNKEAVESYLRRMSSTLGPALGGKLGDGLRAMFCDSIELSGANWTTDFSEEFQRRRGYRLEPWYPFALYDPHQGYAADLPADPIFADEIRRVRYDFNRTFTELFHERFIRVFHAWCRENGVLSRYQAYGGPGLMDMLSGYLIPDIPEGDNWIFHPPGNQLPLNGIRYAVWNKYAASGAHLTGKRLVSCEAMTNLRGVFQATLEYIKQASDLDMMTGVNHFVLHGFNYSPPEAGFPGWVRYGTYFNEHNPWWPHVRRWADYTARLCSVLQASQPQAQVAILGPTADVWSKGGVERQGFIHTPWYLHLVWQALQQNGCDADYINGSALCKATFKDGRLLHGPMAYDLLIIANVESLEPETAQAIMRYAKAGGKIAFVGKTPTRSPGLQDRAQNDLTVKAAMTAALAVNLQQVAVIEEPGKDALIPWVTATLERFRVIPAVRISSPDPMLFQIHRVVDGRGIFLFSNQGTESAVSFHGTFATGERTPWRWNPETGERSAFPHGAKKNELDITLEPLESLLLVFEPAMPASAMPLVKIDRSTAVAIQPPWQLTLEPAIGVSVTQELAKLEDLGLSENKTFNTFAGKAVYRVKFSVTDLRQSILSLGRVHGVSEVILNGKALGVRWWGVEYVYDTQGALRLGDNELEVRVTTVLSNYCRTLKDNRMAMVWAEDHKPVSTGLIGPVALYREKD